ncbi:hypoxia induced protein region [Ancylostoma ceylanicum]|uniref:Hypoxia induced protein region n=1 Tax=Ancylostoma ceylanicum TaxID=53326 RepID=A0A0D6MCB1_9BILA|nr:hypoxia induced protein region [Ancylostoma ceylanicum]
MGIFRKVFMSAAGIHEEPRKGSYEWKKEHLTAEQMSRTSDNEARYSGIPAIPTDIGYSSGKETGGKKKSGVVSQAASNPGVILGMGLTTLALLGMFSLLLTFSLTYRSSFIGDKLGAQKYMQYRIMAQFFTVTALVAGKYMQYRIMAQFFTVTALVAGVTFFGATYEDEEVTKARENAPPPTAILHKH